MIGFASAASGDSRRDLPARRDKGSLVYGDTPSIKRFFASLRMTGDSSVIRHSILVLSLEGFDIRHSTR